MSGPDRAAVGDAAARAARRFRSHGGGVAVRGVEGGRVGIAFTGFCTGCACRPQCLVATVEPELLAVPGVAAVDAVGVRLDADARARLDAFLQTPSPAGGRA